MDRMRSSDSQHVDSVITCIVGIDMMTEEEYREETLKHADRVMGLLDDVAYELDSRAIIHDKSKLSEEEAPIFQKFTPKLKDSTYGSDEYNGFLERMKPALEHHYRENRHHPEHHPYGIHDMTLIDLVEMLCDWKAASERHDNGDIVHSINVNTERFGICPELSHILMATARVLGWIKEN